MPATVHGSAPAGAEEAQTIATLRADELVDGVFACTRKERQISRAGSPYLTVELRDSTGTMVGRAFRDADLLAGRFDRGDLVRVSGRVERFRDELQLALTQIARAEGPEADPASFLPVAYRDLDELDGFLEHLAREVYDPPLRSLLQAMLGDEDLRAEIRTGPVLAARGGRGGAHRRRPPCLSRRACSSTPSRSPRWSRSCASCTPAWTATCS